MTRILAELLRSALNRRLAWGNPHLSRLQPYPFDKLRALFAGVTPPALRSIRLSIGRAEHAPPLPAGIERRGRRPIQPCNQPDDVDARADRLRGSYLGTHSILCAGREGALSAGAAAQLDSASPTDSPPQ
jgi:N-succinyldiaminopimelate aminotransferase